MQRRRQRQPAETLGLRHLHGRLQTPSGKSVATVWKNGSELYAPDRRHERRLGLLRLRGQRHGLRRGLRAAGRRDRRQNLGERRLEIHRRTGFGQRLSLFDFGRGRQSLRRRQRGRERRPDGQNLEGRHGGLRLFGEPRRVAGQSRGRRGGATFTPQAASEADSGKQLAVVWKNDKAHFTLSDGQTDAGATALCLDGRTFYTAGYAGTQAIVWKDGSVFYTLTDGSLGPGHRRLPLRKRALRRGLRHRRLRERGCRLEERPGTLRPFGRFGRRLDTLCHSRLRRRRFQRRDPLRNVAHRRGVARREDPPHAHRRHGTRRGLLDVRRTALRLTRRIGNGKGHGLSGAVSLLCAIPRPEE